MILIFAIPVFCLICVLLHAFFHLHNLVVFEREHYPDEWESDGFPEFYLFGGNFAASACAFCWLFLTPDWIPRHEQTVRSLRQMRMCVLIWNLGILLVVLAAGRVFR